MAIKDIIIMIDYNINLVMSALHLSGIFVLLVSDFYASEWSLFSLFDFGVISNYTHFC